MDPTTPFFNKLRKLAVTLETETAKLLEAFERRSDEDRDSETTARATRAYHGLHGDLGDLKGLLRDQLAQEEARDKEVSNFIQACRVMEKRLAQDVQTVKAHWEKYGYQAPRDVQKPSKAKCKGIEDEEEADEKNDSAEEKEGCQAGGAEEEEEEDKNGEDHPSTPPKSELPLVNVMQTPQLSDFGLCETQLKRALAGMEWCSEVPPMPQMPQMPQMSLPPPPALNLPSPPTPITPKYALRMDEVELQTPQMHNFGISEDTMSLNNDFTMHLFRKNANRQPVDVPLPAGTSVMDRLSTKAVTLGTPEPPALCTPGLKIRKTNGHCSSSVQVSSDPESPCRTQNLPSTPDVPTFQTPYVNRLVGTKQSARQPDTVNLHDDDDGHIFDLPSPRNGTAGSKQSWEYNVPDISIMGLEDKDLPEMPNLESVLGHSLINKNATQLQMGQHEKIVKDAPVNGLDVDGATQEFSLGMPRVRVNYQEPGTPEMPDLSSVTQDICKLVSLAQLKKTKTAHMQPHIRPENNPHRAASVSDISEREFQSLPNHLRQMTLSNLNAAVHSINKFTKDHRGEVMELRMDELKRIIGVGTKAPVYILCLAELRRLHNVGEFQDTSVYKLVTHN